MRPATRAATNAGWAAILAVAALGALAPTAACKTERPTPEAAAPAPAVADAGGKADATAEDDDDVRPVYPVDGVEPHPLATKLCGALHDLPESRRAACCREPSGLVVTKECVRMLSAALRGGAVTVDAADVDRCAAAMENLLDGCEWVGPFPPEQPAACLGLVKGQLAARARCRSSLECEGSLRCQGVGPTTPGKCAPARDDGAGCGGTVDALATFVRQNDLETTHPECKGFCSRIKCASPGAAGSPCARTRECGPGLQCLGAAKNAAADPKAQRGACTPKAPSKLGEPCPGETCEAGSQCVQGTCVARRPAGAACENDFQCLGGCVRPDAGAGGGGLPRGRCGQKCGVR
jgi:hypothetical protein